MAAFPAEVAEEEVAEEAERGDSNQIYDNLNTKVIKLY